MPGPFRIFIGGQELEGWTEATLSRSKKQLTGQLNVTVFFSYVPKEPVMRQAVRGAEVRVYVGGHLAFFGSMDKRIGKGNDASKQAGGAGGDSSGISRSVNIGPDSYVIKLSARGKTKRLVDSAHEHPTSTMLQPTDQDVVNEVIKNHDIGLEWLGEIVNLDKIRLRDGASIIEELHRIGSENAHYIYETRDGKLRVCDGPIGGGEPLVLGDNIMTFSAEQSESTAKEKIVVKGQRIKKNIRGKDAVIDRQKELKDDWPRNGIPVYIQHYGDATDEALERRAKFEADRRAQSSKKVTIEVFHVQSRSGAPWDIGQLHYVEVPPEGIFEAMECTNLTYTVQADKTLKTTLTLSPPAASGVSGGVAFGGIGGLAGLPEIDDLAATGKSRAQQLGISLIPGQYPDPWGSANLSISNVEPLKQIAINALDSIIDGEGPDLTLPPGF